MKAGSLLLLLGLSAALGVFLGWRRLHHLPNKPVHRAVHLLLGLAGLQGLAMLRRGAPDGTVVPVEALGTASALLLVLAMMSGLLASVIARHVGRRPVAATLLVYVTVGAGGFVLFIVWLLQARLH